MNAKQIEKEKVKDMFSAFDGIKNARLTSSPKAKANDRFETFQFSASKEKSLLAEHGLH